MKVLNKVSTDIAVKQVEISSLVTNLEEVVHNAHSLYKKLCNVEEFTKDNQDLIDKLQLDLKSTRHSLSMDASSNSIHFNRLTHT